MEIDVTARTTDEVNSNGYRHGFVAMDSLEERSDVQPQKGNDKL